MQVEVVKSEKKRMKIEFKDEPQTFPQLLATQIWKEGGESAAVQEHPFMKNPELIVSGTNPKKLLEKASTAIESQCDEFEKEFSRALKK